MGSVARPHNQRPTIWRDQARAVAGEGVRGLGGQGEPLAKGFPIPPRLLLACQAQVVCRDRGSDEITAEKAVWLPERRRQLPERPKHAPRTQVRIMVPSGLGTRASMGSVARPHNQRPTIWRDRARALAGEGVRGLGGQGPSVSAPGAGRDRPGFRWGAQAPEGPLWFNRAGTPCQGVPHTPQIKSSMLSSSSTATVVSAFLQGR